MPTPERRLFFPWKRSPSRFFSPRSLAGLVGLGFTLVVLPLIILVGVSAFVVDRLSSQSEQTAYQAMQLTQNSLILMEELVTMERSARQYQVVNAPALLQVFKTSHKQFLQALSALERQSVNAALAARIRRLGLGEKKLAERIEIAARGGGLPSDINADFEQLDNEAYQLWEGSRREVAARASALRERAQFWQHILFWGTLVVIMASLLLGIGLSRLILRPVRQIDRAIHRLGDGDFSIPVRVHGPRDLEYLGERLDWTRQRLLDLESSKRRFLRDVSHDLKTPLATLLEGADLLQDQVVGSLNAEQAGLVRILRDSATQLQERINRLIQYNRIHGQVASLDLKYLELGQLLRDSLKEHEAALKSRDLRCDISIKDGALWGDEEKLRQVIDNLLSNAIKYAPRKSMIRVSIDGDEQHVCLRVADQGQGIDEADREHLFDAFFRGRPPENGVANGSGIGLAIVKEYVEAHRGTVALLGTQSGEGAVFEVCLPRDLRNSAT